MYRGLVRHFIERSEGLLKGCLFTIWGLTTILLRRAKRQFLRAAAAAAAALLLLLRRRLRLLPLPTTTTPAIIDAVMLICTSPISFNLMSELGSWLSAVLALAIGSK